MRIFSRMHVVWSSSKFIVVIWMYPARSDSFKLRSAASYCSKSSWSSYLPARCLSRDKGKPLNCTCVRSWGLRMFAMVALSNTSLSSGVPRVVDVVACGPGRLAMIRGRRLRSEVETTRDVAGMPCIRQACHVCVAPIAPIAAHTVFCWSDVFLSFSSYS